MDKSKTDSPRKQKQLGPAPIASFEDTSSDELKFKIDLTKTESQLSNIMEHDSPNKRPSMASTDNNSSKSMPAVQSRNVLRVSKMPRIDISRASSSSQHEDSRDSSPENVFEQVGTGTLQEGDANQGDLGFSEDGANDLKSSTEELYLIEGDDKTKIKVEQEKDWHPTRSSPVLFKFDEKQQACLQQNARKDSVSSEVAALLCISGRTSRVSSVGSQGSAVSRLSAVSGVSGVSRTPSPHKMLLETSFCGPKPLNSNVKGALVTGESIAADELEQIILARKHDLTKAVFAEGFNIDTSTPKKIPIRTKDESVNGDIKEKLEKVLKKRTQIITDGSLVPRGSVNTKKGGVLKKNNNRTIVGVTPSGTQYIRIKLKPDEQYGTDGNATNEHVVEEAEISKPDTLSLKNAATKKAAPHFTQLVQNDETNNKRNDHHLTPSASPKPSRNTNIRSTNSRSPSPAAGVSISRKSSFCSLFKAKETASPDSPSGQRKKSAISILLDSPRDRSRSKSRESDKSANSTPSKQRSILAIFKPRRSSSKSSSPVDPEIITATNEAITTKKLSQKHRSRKQSPKPEIGQQRPGSTTPRLRYYDTPDDKNAIYIPLHTPPDEKEGEFTFSSPAITIPSKPSYSAIQIITSAEISEPQPMAKTPQSEQRSVKPHVTKSIVSTSTTPTAAVQSKATKSYRVELPDGSIRIPLRSPSDENPESNDIENESQQWSTVVQMNSSQESQDTVVSSKAPSLVSNEINPNKASAVSTVVAAQLTPITNPVEQKTELPVNEVSQEEIVTVPIEIANGGIRAMSKERKRILFTTKIGSGSEEQIFATQLSLSKTESLSSQLSEQTPTLDSPATDKNDVIQHDEVKRELDAQHSQENEMKPLVKMRSKEDADAKDPEAVYKPKAVKEEKINVNRHSMFIENIEEIMENQKRIEMQRRSSNAKEQRKLQRDSSVEQEKLSARPVKQKRENKSQSSKSRDSTEEHKISAGGSSGSEQDSEIDPKNRMPRQIGVVEEESTGLVSQESYDDELPYVPTTLPEERTLGVAIMPIRDRALMEVKTCPVERPRSTTPLNPSYLEEYCLNDDFDGSPFIHGEKLRINLPRKDIKEGTTAQKTKSPRRISNANGKNWFEFAEQGIGGTSNTLCSPSNSHGKEIQTDSPTVRKPLQNTAEWIDFENIPEKRKPAKRITTLPHKDQMMGESSHHIQYNYVNPDECQCECHGAERDASSNKSDSEKKESLTEDQSPDDCVPLLESDPEENLNRNINVEAIDIGANRSSDIWRQQSFGAETQDSNQAQKSSFDSAGSQSPVLTRSNKTTTVQLPQRLQR